MSEIKRGHDFIRKFDAYIGTKLKLIRYEHALPQATLAKIMGVSIQQIQKYENGENNVRSARLALVVKEFGCDINFFFDGINFEYFETGEGSIFLPGKNLFFVKDLKVIQENIIKRFMNIKNRENINLVKSLINKIIKLENFEKKHETVLEEGN